MTTAESRKSLVFHQLEDLGVPAADRGALADAVLGEVDAGSPEGASTGDSQALTRRVRDHYSGALVRQAQRGEALALERLLDLWQDDIARICKWHAPPGISWDDVAQDVMVTIMTSIGGVRDPLAFRSWLWGTVWRKVRGRQRRAWFRRWTSLGEDDHEPPDPEPEGARTEWSWSVRAVLATLRPDERKMLWLVYVEGYTRPEAARFLQIPEGSLNRKLSAARRRFEQAARARDLAPRPPEEVPHG